MSSRISLYLERLTLDDLLFLESEIDRRKDRYRKEHVVLAVQTEQKLLTSIRRETLSAISKEMRRYFNECAAAGSGIQLAFSPEVSLLLFRDVSSAAKAASTILTGLAELNGKLSTGENRLSFKMGLACGVDALAAGSMRAVRQSVIVKRASQCAWKAPAGSMFIDEKCLNHWVPRNEPTRVPIEIEGQSVYRVAPNSTSLSPAVPVADEERLIEFLDMAVKRNMLTLKYSLLREEVDSENNSTWSKPVARAVIVLEAFDSEQMRNVTFTTKCALSEYASNVERIKRMVSDRKLGLVKHEDASSLTAR